MLGRRGRWAFVLAMSGSLVVLGACSASEPADLAAKETPPENKKDGSLSSRTDAGTTSPTPEASVDPDASPPPSDGGRGLLVFVSSTVSSARFGGQIGADAKCTALASAAGHGGTWVAWLSKEGGPHAIDRLTSDGPWQLFSGEVVAASKADLTSQLKHAIDRDERGIAVPASRVWTGTGPNGKYNSNDCDRWTNGENGRYGDTTRSDVGWTSAGVDDCDTEYRFYCFQP